MQAMADAAPHFLGTHDFKTFCELNFYQKDYPKVHGGIVNRKVTTDYFQTNMDIDINDNEKYNTRWCLIEENTNYEDEPKYIKGGTAYEV